MAEKLVIVGAGVAGVNAATKLVDNGYPGKDITIIDMGKDPYRRPYSEVMTGFLGAGGWSDGKLTYHTAIGGHMSKYCGEEKAMELFDEVINNFKRFHPKPEEVQCSNPVAEPDFIKPYFGLRLFPVWHVGTDYLHEIGKNWYDFLVDNGVEFIWETKVTSIDFDAQELFIGEEETFINPKNWPISYDRLMFAVGKSGIDFGKQLADDYKLPTEPKPVQIGVRFEAPQKHFQKLIDVSYDFKLYRKFEDKGVSLRSFCTNNNAAYVAVEQTYGDHSYNGHAKKDEKYRNDMTNFGILMEVNGIEEPFKWSRDLVSKVNKDGTGLYYSPTRTPSTTSEGEDVSAVTIDQMDEVRDAFQGYYSYIDDFIEDMKKVFPTLGDDWGVYIPEVKYLSPEPLVNYSDLSLVDYDNVHFVGDALSARGITVSGAQGIYVTDYILESHYPDEFPEFVEHF
ncbi:FAD-dependent oxidoreductase [bacterium]|jgi:uncharacterized FAD-dependent dehydrogenase|nr:FAD-dependent oxidoreductase [bacterium]